MGKEKVETTRESKDTEGHLVQGKLVGLSHITDPDVEFLARSHNAGVSLSATSRRICGSPEGRRISKLPESRMAYVFASKCDLLRQAGLASQTDVDANSPAGPRFGNVNSASQTDVDANSPAGPRFGNVNSASQTDVDANSPAGPRFGNVTSASQTDVDANSPAGPRFGNVNSASQTDPAA
ncbi:hypothetical protein Bbelb_211270 [Branchiostoma belcheri]|nr:hypothetical protein Bbelb_211270 [Branchiostoma belcheri]